METTLQKAVVWTFGIALATTLLMKDRQTVPVITAFSKFIQGTLGTAMGLVKPAA